MYIIRCSETSPVEISSLCLPSEIHDKLQTKIGSLSNINNLNGLMNELIERDWKGGV